MKLTTTFPIYVSKLGLKTFRASCYYSSRVPSHVINRFRFIPARIVWCQVNSRPAVMLGGYLTLDFY